MALWPWNRNCRHFSLTSWRQHRKRGPLSLLLGSGLTAAGPCRRPSSDSPSSSGPAAGQLLPAACSRGPWSEPWAWGRRQLTALPAPHPAGLPSPLRSYCLWPVNNCCISQFTGQVYSVSWPGPWITRLADPGRRPRRARPRQERAPELGEKPNPQQASCSSSKRTRLAQQPRRDGGRSSWPDEA